MLGKKIHKEAGAEPTELEEQVAQVRLSGAAGALWWAAGALGGAGGGHER